jgi:D-arabinose 1-dehydrogenase-like Zn-dependent alcohol dehydrogenase
MTSLAQPRALISYGPHNSGGWKLHPVTVRALREKELLVEIVASGICQTDLHFAGAESGFGVYYPRVMGHEGVQPNLLKKCTGVVVADAVL